MYKLLLIGLGGFLGTILRYGVGGLVQNWSKSATFPYGTLVVNLLGCLAIGLVSQLVESYGVLSPEIRSFVLIGVFGAFTTFSTFGNETINLVRNTEGMLAFANVSLHIVLGLGAVWLGRTIVDLVWR